MLAEFFFFKSGIWLADNRAASDSEAFLENL